MFLILLSTALACADPSNFAECICSSVVLIILIDSVSATP
jgi:hypothetical protein